MKHKLPKILLAGAAVAAVIGFTVSYFKDTETSAGNKFVAGKFNLQVGSQCTYNGDIVTECNWLTPKDLSNELFFNFDDVKPGDFGENTLTLKIDNNPAWVCAELYNLKSYDNGCELPENLVDDPATSCDTPGLGQGELQNNLKFTVWKDTDCDNILDPETPGVPGTNGHCEGEFFNPCTYYLDPGSCEAESQIFGCYWNEDFCDGPPVSCDDFHTEEECNRPEPGCYWTPGTPGTPGTPAEQVVVNNQPADTLLWPIADSTTQTGPLPGGTNNCYGFSWNVPLETSNIIQTDSFEGDIRFTAVQSRHMDNFKCTDLFTEVCDGVDNDYDKEVDEGPLWTNKGQACSVGSRSMSHLRHLCL